MAPLTLIRDLRLHLRAWARHRIHFGIAAPQSRLPLCSTLFSSACTGVTAPGRLTAVPGGMDVAVTVSDDALVYRFPYGHQDPRRRGKLNPRFLEPDGVRRSLRALKGRVSAVMLPVPFIYRTEELSPEQFASCFDRFLAALPDGPYIAPVLQNGEFLQPDYFALLARHGAVHVISEGPLMPPLLEQVQIPSVFTAGRVIVRTAASRDPLWQLGLTEAIRRCLGENRELFVYCSEGEDVSVEMALMQLMDLLKPDLAKRSPLRRRAA